MIRIRKRTIHGWISNADQPNTHYPATRRTISIEFAARIRHNAREARSGDTFTEGNITRRTV